MSRRRLLAVGTALVLCLPVLMAAGGLWSYFTPRWYFSSVIVEPGALDFRELKHALPSIAPSSPDVSLEQVRNTDLVQIGVRSLDPQAAADQANSIAAELAQRDSKLRILQRAEPPASSVRPNILANAALGGAVAFFPAMVGLILMVPRRLPPELSLIAGRSGGMTNWRNVPVREALHHGAVRREKAAFCL